MNRTKSERLVCQITGANFDACSCIRCCILKFIGLRSLKEYDETQFFKGMGQHLKYHMKDCEVGKIYEYQSQVYILCEAIDASGQCTGPIVLKTDGLSKQKIIDGCLDIISKHGEQEVITKLLDKTIKS